MLTYHRLRIMPGFLLLIALLYYLDDGVGIMIWTVLAAIIHELGHILAARMMGGTVERIVLSVTGAELRFAYQAPLTYGKENLLLLAGPMANLLFGLPALYFRAYIPALVSFCLAIFNLLPLAPTDGGQIFYNLLAETAGLVTADRTISVLSSIFTGIIFGLGIISIARFANPTLLIISIWLTAGIVKQKTAVFL